MQISNYLLNLGISSGSSLILFYRDSLTSPFFVGCQVTGTRNAYIDDKLSIYLG